MECKEARLLIDERVNGSLTGDLARTLDEHLKSCADCRDDLRQLERVRGLLSNARQDNPQARTLANIWSAVQAQTRSVIDQPQTPASEPVKGKRFSMSTTATVQEHLAARPFTDRRWKLIAAASLTAAAVLVVSFVVGQAQFDSGRHERMAKSPSIQTQTEYTRSTESKDGRHRGDAMSSRHDTPPTDPNSKESSNIIVPRDVLERAELGDHFDTINPDRPDVKGAFGNPDAHMFQSVTGEATKGSGGGWGDGSGTEKKSKELKYDWQGKADAPDREDKRADKAERVDDARSGAKIIKTGELTLEVKNFTEGSRAIDQLVVRLGASIADNRTSDMPGATRRSEIVIRVAPEKFEELFGELKKLGLVLHERAGGLDITAQYTDTEARIKNLQVAEERLQDLIKSKSFIDKVQSLLEVERELSRVRGEIESMQGQMRVWNNQIALSTIRVTLQEPSRAVPSGSLSVEVPALSDAKKNLDSALTSAGAQLLAGQTSKRNDGTLMGSYTVRVKFGRFAELMSQIKGLGRVQDERIQNQPFANSVPEGAQDVPCEVNLVLFERAIQLPTGTLHLEVPQIGELKPKLDLALANAQATITNNQSQRQPDGSSTSHISIRVTAGNFAGLVDAVSGLGRVTHRAVSGESNRVQGGAAEVPCTLTLVVAEPARQVPTGSMGVEVPSFAEAREKLSALTKNEGLQVQGSDSNQRPDGTWAGTFRLGIKAEKMDTVVGEIEKVGRVKSRQLQGLGLGDLSKTDPNVIGEVVLTLEEKPSITPQEEGSFRSMLRDTFGGFLGSMGYIVRGFGMILPWALMLGLFVWLVSRFVGTTATKQTIMKSAENVKTPKQTVSTDKPAGGEPPTQ
jgi:hypothetical protein